MSSRTNLVVVAVTAIVMLGCNGDSNIQPASPLAETVPFKVDMDYPGFHGEISDDDLIDESWEDEFLRGSENSVVVARYHTQGQHRVTLFALQGDEGVIGKGRIKGPVYVDVRFDIVCVNEVGDRATVGGEVTYADLGDNPLEIPIEPGWIMYLAIEDNGFGFRSDPDRYHNEVYLGTPGVGAFCDLLDPTNPIIWAEDEWFDVAKKYDFIHIK